MLLKIPAISAVGCIAALVFLSPLLLGAAILEAIWRGDPAPDLRLDDWCWRSAPLQMTNGAIKIDGVWQFSKRGSHRYHTVFLVRLTGEWRYPALYRISTN